MNRPVSSVERSSERLAIAIHLDVYFLCIGFDRDVVIAERRMIAWSSDARFVVFRPARIVTLGYSGS